jgi:glycosyltransferase involved in cell wall biosynthesis
MKVAIIEPFLVDYTGHYYSFVSELKCGFEELGDEVEVFLPENSKVDITEGKMVLPPVISHVVIPKKYKGYISFLKETIKIRKVIKAAQKNSDFLIFSTADDWRILNALALGKIIKPVILYFHTFMHLWDKKQKSSKLFKFLIRLKIPKQPLNFLTTIDLDCESNELKIPTNVRLFPNAPYPLNYPLNFKESNKDNDFYIVYTGAPARIKNFIKLTEVISSAPENYGFIVQCNSPVGFYEPETLEAVKSLKGIKREKKIILLESSLSKEEYFKALNQGSIVWCLYDPDWYKWCISGILLEAWSLGKPVITTSGTWMAKQVEKYGGGIVLDTMEVQDILKAIEIIRDDYARFSAEAEAAGRILYEKNNGLALARFIKDIVNINLKLFSNTQK